MIHSGTRETFLKIGDLLHALPISGGSVQFLRHPHTQTYTQFHTQTYTQFYTQTYTQFYTQTYTPFYTQTYTQFQFFLPLWDCTIFASFETGQFLQVFPKFDGLTFQPFITLFAWFEMSLNKWIKYYNIFFDF